MVNVAILEDHPIVITGYETTLKKSAEINLVGSALFGEDLMPLLARNKVDVLILDIEVPVSPKNENSCPFFQMLTEVFDTYPEIGVLVISSYKGNTTVSETLGAGVTGYLFKDDVESMDALAEKVLTVANGDRCLSKKAELALERLEKRHKTKHDLTKRQIEVLSLCQSYPNLTTRQIAGKLEVAPSTIRNLLSDSYTRLQVRNIKGAITKFRELGYAPNRDNPFHPN
jgi:DNA-binding NarL/FixJ family response regulator